MKITAEIARMVGHEETRKDLLSAVRPADFLAIVRDFSP